jgi:peptidoglycan hydrolase-like protein with peptidoglycan-binding domain
MSAEAAKDASASRNNISSSLPEKKSEEPVLMLVSLDKQSIQVFSGDTLVARSRISSGKRGHSTPTGIFSILQKKRRHHSNIYSRAPMPFMQRLTWSGIALHESKSVPNYPASHGCVRLPGAFAKQLYGYTSLGAHVIMTSEELTLRPVLSNHLFYPEGKLPNPAVDAKDSPSVLNVVVRQAELQGPGTGATPASTLMPATDKSGPGSIGQDYTLRSGLDADMTSTHDMDFVFPDSSEPIRILITRRTGRDLMRDIQTMLNNLGFEAGDVDGWMGPATGKAIVEFQKVHSLSPTGTASIELARLLHEKSGRKEFSSGHIYVRQEFKPLFDAPIALKTPEKPLGTHFLSALPSRVDPKGLRWVGTTLADRVGESHLTEIVEGSQSQIIMPPTVKEALGRTELPDYVRKRLSKMIVAGSSLVISDQGISDETLNGTDFVVLTNSPDPN